jgi:hypothetical protein
MRRLSPSSPPPTPSAHRPPARPSWTPSAPFRPAPGSASAFRLRRGAARAGPVPSEARPPPVGASPARRSPLPPRVVCIPPQLGVRACPPGEGGGKVPSCAKGAARPRSGPPRGAGGRGRGPRAPRDAARPGRAYRAFPGRNLENRILDEEKRRKTTSEQIPFGSCRSAHTEQSLCSNGEFDPGSG